MRDALLTNATGGYYDFQLDATGDIATRESFDTAILYSLFGERRATADEMPTPQLRRGWIGNDADFENGSKLWLFTQARLTRTNLNRIEDEAKKALQWLVDDGLAVAIDDVRAYVASGRPFLDVTIRTSRDNIANNTFDLWELTGRAA